MFDIHNKFDYLNWNGAPRILLGKIYGMIQITKLDNIKRNNKYSNNSRNYCRYKSYLKNPKILHEHIP